MDLRFLSMELLCPELEDHDLYQDMDGATGSQSPPSVDLDREMSAGFPGSGLGPSVPPGKGSIPLSVLVLSLLVLLVSSFFAVAALIAYAFRRRDKLPFRKQGEVDLAGIQMECGIFTEQTYHHHHGLQKPASLVTAEHSHVYNAILPSDHIDGADRASSTPVCRNPIYKEEDEGVTMKQQCHPQLCRSTGSEGKFCLQEKIKNVKGYPSMVEKEREWTLERSSLPINTIAMLPLAGFHENGILCPTMIDSQGPTPKVELVNCLFVMSAPEFRDLPDRYARPPPRYSHPQGPKQDAGPRHLSVVTGARPNSSSSQNQSEDSGDLRSRLRTQPDYLEVVHRSYQF